MRPSLQKKLPTKQAIALLESGLALHRVGRLEEALAVYARVLRQDSGNSEAWRLQGAAYGALGLVGEAIASLKSALRFQPKSVEAHYDLGNALQANQELPAAVASYRHALRLRPKFPEALCNLGNALMALQQFPEAIAVYGESLKQKSGVARVLNNLSVAHRTLGHAAESVEAARAAVAAEPGYIDAWQNLALACAGAKDTRGAVAANRRVVILSPRATETVYRLGRALQEDRQHAAAAAAYREALTIDPHNADALLELGVAVEDLGRWEEARDAYTRYQALRPDSTKALNNLGTTFQKQRRFGEAIATFQKADAMEPGSRTILRNLGIALWSDKQWDEALVVARQLLSFHPDDVEGLHNLAVALTTKHEIVEAEAVIQRSLALNPQDAEAYVCRGNLLLAMNRATEAITAYHTATTLNSNLPVARYNEGIAQLLTGDLRSGWMNYEFRFHDRSAHERNRFDRPRLQPGESLAGRTILVHAEQGLGDTLQFARYVPLLAAQGATVHVEVQPALRALLADLPGAASVFARGETPPAVDCHCPLLSVPRCVGTALSTIPPPMSVSAPPDRLAAWATRLGSGRAMRVGVVWSGNPKHGNDHNRSVPLAEFARVFALPEVQFFSLQKEVAPSDAALLTQCSNVTDLSAQLGDLADTAAVIEQLDLVIAVDTSVAHLAGSLGKPVWILLPFSPDWRWLLERTDSPWYPTATLFRQTSVAEWKNPLAQVMERLGKPGAQAAA